MEALKLIPQLFFDLLGRMMPGFLAMLLGLLVYLQTGQDFSWKDLSEVPFWLVMIVAYIIGHLVSPLTKSIQRWNTIKESISAENKDRNQKAQSHLLEILSKESEDSTNKRINKKSMSAKEIRSYMYNWLRLNKPDSGGLCAKLRAEFTMYNSFAAIFLISTIVEIVILIRSFLISQEICLINAWLTIAFLVLFWGMLKRGHEGEDTFGKDVKSFYELANAPEIE